MDFPLIDLMGQDACYAKLRAALHPDGLSCPDRKADDHLQVNRRHRDPVLDHHRTACGRVFDAVTGTELDGTHRRPAEILPILRGFAQGVPTARLARELGCDRKHLLGLRRRLLAHAERCLDRRPLGDPVVEADQVCQDAGEEGREHDDPDDPPRRRGNERRGHGTLADDRPPVAGVVGRESGEVRPEVIGSANASGLGDMVAGSSLADATVSTGEWNGYNGVGDRHERVHVTVSHSGSEGG